MVGSGLTSELRSSFEMGLYSLARKWWWILKEKMVDEL